MNVVLSVGPYPLMRRVVGSAASARRTCATDKASPPTNSCSIGTSVWGASSTTALNNEVVSHSAFTRCLRITALNRAGAGTRSGNNTHRPPCTSAPQTSNVEASKAGGASCSQTCSALNVA